MTRAGQLVAVAVAVADADADAVEVKATATPGAKFKTMSTTPERAINP